MSHHEHRPEAPTRLRLAVVTFSDTRGEADDVSGRALRDGFAAAGHEVVRYALSREEPAAIRTALQEALAAGVDAVVSNGGTGLTSRDGTIEIAGELIAKPLPGFGELFRLLSFQQIGAAAMLSRACAGLTRDRRLLLCLPGSTAAVTLALHRLLLPELPHLVREARR